jgi:hypothetical protein
MYTGLQHLHSTTAYLTFLFLTVAIINAFYHWFGRKPFSKSSKTINILGLVGTHTQILLGLVLYFVSPLGFSNFSGEAMKEASSRLYIVEHPFTMIIAAVIITIGYSRAKRAPTDIKKFKNIAIFFTIGLILILIRIPWKAWL